VRSKLRRHRPRIICLPIIRCATYPRIILFGTFRLTIR
jgi:hypothetical protein